MITQDAVPAGNFLTTLFGQLAPVIVPLIASGVTYVLNKATGFISGWPNAAKQGLYIAFSVGLGFVGTRFGLDISTVGAFAASVFGLGLFHIGKASNK
jgi:hypothetical protein